MGGAYESGFHFSCSTYNGALLVAVQRPYRRPSCALKMASEDGLHHLIFEAGEVVVGFLKEKYLERKSLYTVIKAPCLLGTPE